VPASEWASAQIADNRVHRDDFDDEGVVGRHNNILLPVVEVPRPTWAAAVAEDLRAAVPVVHLAPAAVAAPSVGPGVHWHLLVQVGHIPAVVDAERLRFHSHLLVLRVPEAAAVDLALPEEEDHQLQGQGQW